MIRVLGFLLFVFLLGIGFAWLADRPGDMVVTFDGYQYRVSLMVAAVVVAAVVATVMIVWWLLKSIWNSPQSISRYFRVRRRDRGYQALSSGMIAAGAGDAATARRMNKQASKLINADQEPLLHLLDAQASLLEGDHESARAKFEAMLDDPEMRLLGLRGLYLEAERLGDREAARHYAERAATQAPQLGWASTAALEARTEDHDWDAALRILDSQKSTRQLERETAERRRAVLLTAKAMDLLEADPAAARNAGLEANRLAPELVPAALVAARALFRQNDLRKGAKIIETAWKKEPHPELAALYVQARPGDSTHDRLERAKRLKSLRPNNAESSLAVARAAFEAGDHDIARSEAEAALRLSPREGVYLLLADIEEAHTGDIGKVRQLLARALSAPRDPSWVADGIVAEHWAPISPVSGRLDAFEWRGPEERPGRLLEQEIEDEDDALHPVVALTVVPPATVIQPTPDSPAEPRTEPAVASPNAAGEILPESPAAVPPVPSNPSAGPIVASAPAPERTASEITTTSGTVSGPEKPGNVTPLAPVASPPRPMTEPAAVSHGQGDSEPVEDVRPSIPDDPGVMPEEQEKVRSRFRLF